jgi:thymidylate synthase (FAD)
MKHVDLRVHLIAKSTVDNTAIRAWLDDIGAVSCPWPQEDANLTGGESVIGLAAKRCYMSFSAEDGLNPNITRVRKDWTDYLDNILKSGHGSVLEHATYTFAVEGISRVFTGEVNRHRAGVAISEGSMRYIRFNDIPYWIPTSIQFTPEELAMADKFGSTPLNVQVALEGGLDKKPTAGEKDALTLVLKKFRTQLVFKRHFSQTEVNYAELQEIWKDELAPTSKFHAKKQITSMLRRIIPMGVATGTVLTLNFRALRHIIALRASPAAEEEIALVFAKIGKIMVESEPRLFGDFTQTPEGYWCPKYQKI